MSLPTCPTCVYAKGICKKTGVEIRTTTGCTYHTPKPITNADRIRAMTDEELANKMSGLESFALTCGGGWPPEKWLDWLRQEAEHGCAD